MRDRRLLLLVIVALLGGAALFLIVRLRKDRERPALSPTAEAPPVAAGPSSRPAGASGGPTTRPSGRELSHQVRDSQGRPARTPRALRGQAVPTLTQPVKEAVRQCAQPVQGRGVTLQVTFAARVRGGKATVGDAKLSSRGMDAADPALESIRACLDTSLAAMTVDVPPEQGDADERVATLVTIP